MADTEQTSGTEENPVQGTEETEETTDSTTENPEEESTEESTEDPKEDDLPEWARNELARVRKEAADRRIANRELNDRLKDAKTPEEVEALTKEYAEKIAGLERTILVSGIASDFGLPKELAEVLKGDSEEELRAHAKTLSQFATRQEPEQLRGGLNPSDDDTSFDPVAASRKARQRRY